MSTIKSIKALSVKNPWAGLIIAGIKPVENRSWVTMYSGRLAIVSSAKPDAGAMRDMETKLGKLPALCRVHGAILGIVVLIGAIWTADDEQMESDCPDHITDSVLEWRDTDSIGWIFERPKRLRSPIPYKGRLGLYSIPLVLLGDV